jgi:predicted ArsR family transcriptional regulator
MHAKTRLVLALLADDLTDRILVECRAGPRTEAELVSSTGAARNTVASRIAVLEARALLDRVVSRDGTKGRPVVRWTPASEEALATFEGTADAFVLALLDAQVEEQRAAIDARRGRDLRLTPEAGAGSTRDSDEATSNDHTS